MYIHTNSNVIIILRSPLFCLFLLTYTSKMEEQETKYCNIAIIYFITVLHMSTLFFAVLKNQIFGEFTFEMTSYFK